MVAVAADASRFGWLVVAITVGSVVAGAVAAPEAGAAPAVPLAWLLFVGSSVHVAATLGLFSFDEVRGHARRHPARYLLAPGALLAASVAAWLILPAHTRALVLLAFFGWQLWHYQKQNLGLASLAAASAHLPSQRPVERRCIAASGIGGVLALVADPSVLQVVAWRPPASVATTAQILAVLVLGVSIAAAAAATVHRWVTATTTAQAGSVYLVAVTFPIPLVLTRSPYAAIGGLTLAHGLQYLLLVGHVVAGPPSLRKAPADVARLVAIMALVLATAGVLGAVSHLHDGNQIAARVLFGAYLAAVMTHFVVDAGLWRLRDDFPRRWLMERVPQLLGSWTG